MNNWGLTTLIAIYLLPNVNIQAQAAEPEPQVKVLTAAQSEARDRNVDQAALSAQRHAIQTLLNLIKKHKGKTQEILLLLKLGEVYQQAASLEFRIQRGQKTASVKKFHEDAIRVLSDVIARTPNLPEIDQAYAIRGKSYEEIGDKVKAKKDYLFLVKNFPDHPSTSMAYMSLADFAIEENNHKEALTYLSALEARPYDPIHPFALFKMAWSHFNLKNIPTALSYLERHQLYYLKRMEDPKKVSPSDIAIREGSLGDMALFFFDGFEAKLPDYDVEDAYKYFKKQEYGSFYGRMAVRFAKLLRSHKHSDALIKWKNIHLDKEYTRADTLEILTIVFDDYFNQNDFKKVAETSRDMVTLYQKSPDLMQGEPLNKTQKIILDTAVKYQALTIKNKGASEVKELAIVLAQLYDSFTKLVKDDDPRVPRVHYNLAETLFEIGDFDGATTHYRWIVTRGQIKDSIPIDDASLKSISSRHESLNLKKLLVSEIKAKKQQSDDPADTKPEFKEWVEWIDWHLAKYGAKDDGVSQYLFEANRTLYSLKANTYVLDRLQKFAEKFPESKFAIPQVTLALDTAILSEQWQRVWENAEKWLEVQAWKNHSFNGVLYKSASQAYYKLMEADFQGGKFKEVLSRAKYFDKKFSQSDLTPQVLLFAGKSAIQIGEIDEGLKKLDILIDKYPGSIFMAEALFERSKIRESREDFAGTSQDWIRFLTLSEELKKGLKYKPIDFLKRALLFSQLSNTLKPRFDEIEKAKLCVGEENAIICERYRALLSFDVPELQAKAKASSENEDLEDDTRALWALSLLQHSKDLSMEELHNTLKLVAKKFEKNEVDVQMSLLSKLTYGIAQALARGRQLLQTDFAFNPDPNKYIRSIQKRVKAMQKHEEVMASLMKLSWMHLRAMILNETSLIYQDFTDSLRAFPLPKNLSTADHEGFSKAVQDILFPFEEKVQEIRLRAFEIASQRVVDEGIFLNVADGYFKDNASQAKSLKHPFIKGFRVPITVETFEDEKFSPPFSSLWLKAYRDQNTRLMLYALPKEKSVYARAITLAQMGATSEALTELEKNKDFQIQMIVLSHHFASLDQNRMKKEVSRLLEEQTKENPPKLKPWQALMMVYTAINTNLPMSADLKDDLLSRGRKIDIPSLKDAAQDWVKLMREDKKDVPAPKATSKPNSKK